MSSPASEKPGAKIRAGVIGWPVQHSRSPFVHGYWLRQYGIDGSYERFEVTPDELGAFLAALPDKGLAGVNVTVPHKEAAFAAMDTVDELAAKLHADLANRLAERPVTHYGDLDMWFHAVRHEFAGRSCSLAGNDDQARQAQ